MSEMLEKIHGVTTQELEAVENSKEKRVGITETRNTEMDSTQSCKLGRPLPIRCNKIHFVKGNLKEKLTKRGLISLSDYYQKVHI